jgi:AraC-like DNA-binding protein
MRMAKMLEKYYFHQTSPTDLNMDNCGMEDCSPTYRWGPAVRDRYIIHLVTKGRGTFRSAVGDFPVQAGGGFLICPGEIVEYQADQDDPWSYLWVGFHGLRAEGLLLEAGLSSRQPVFQTGQIGEFCRLAERMLLIARSSRSSDLRLLGQLYEFLALLIDEREQRGQLAAYSPQEEYVRQAVRLIAAQYAGPLTVKKIAARIGLDRSYLYTLFCKYLHTTPKAYLTSFRINKAAELLQEPLTIGEVARSVGYEDALLFSRIFKKEKGLPPGQYRQSART